jgi:hypothetical protein
MHRFRVNRLIAFIFKGVFEASNPAQNAENLTEIGLFGRELRAFTTLALTMTPRPTAITLL